MSDSRALQTSAIRILPTGVSKDHFVSEDWLERDLAAVFRPRWLYVGHASELPNPGSFITYSLGKDEVIICRTLEMSLVAYYNFCPHRGHRLCTQDRGQIVGRNFVCPYHGWSYSKDSGACVAATRMNKDFDRSPYALQKAWVEDFNGLIFVSLADHQPAAVADATRHLSSGAGLGGYDTSRLKVAATLHFEVEANWKVLRENDDECYHCQLNHPELVQGYDPWHGFTVVEDLDNPQHLWTLDDWALLELGNAYNAKRVSRVLLPRTDGKDGADNQDVQFFFQPGGHLLLQRDHAWMWSVKPLAPQRTLVSQQWFVAQNAVEGEDYDVATLMELFAVTIKQDTDLCEQVQRGLRMRRYSPGPLNPHHQAPAAAFYQWYERCLASLKIANSVIEAAPLPSASPS